ncbi:uncharacterized protein, partial [Dysidea avara]|uniref:uncharacterized protein n=1 Tax=Dysidea avara TaxID=196820 RepID=UPI0033343974
MEVFHEDLVKTLPFKDAIFCASLQAAGLFYGDLKEKVEAKDTSAEMTLYFLDHGINYNCDNFMKLLTVMENFNSDPVKNLAKEIKKQWSSEPGHVLTSSDQSPDGTPLMKKAKIDAVGENMWTEKTFEYAHTIQMGNMLYQLQESRQSKNLKVLTVIWEFE